MTPDQIRRGVRDYRTRSEVINDVIDTGRSAVDAVLELLEDRNEAVRWSAIRILSEIGDERAIDPLIARIEARDLATDAGDALMAITGKAYRADAAAWRRWRNGQDAEDGPGPDRVDDLELLQDAIKGLPASWSGDGPQYALTVTLPDQRTQQIWIDFAAKTPDGEAVVQLCTPCGKADPNRFESALKLNMTIPFGAVALALLDDALYFAMVDNYLRSAATAQDLSAAIMTLAREGDAMEKSLSNDDRF